MAKNCCCYRTYTRVAIKSLSFSTIFIPAILDQVAFIVVLLYCFEIFATPLTCVLLFSKEHTVETKDLHISLSITITSTSPSLAPLPSSVPGHPLLCPWEFHFRLPQNLIFPLPQHMANPLPFFIYHDFARLQYCNQGNVLIGKYFDILIFMSVFIHKIFIKH